MLWPQGKLLWKALDDDFPMDAVVFASYFERGFVIPTGAFFRCRLHQYGIEVTHHNSNSILAIAFFIHLCEAFIGIASHFELWRRLCHRLHYPNKGKPNVVGGVSL